ncbi:iron chelate uptake ABC transporter family permease subunit [Streptomyces sp. M10(2022)]
MAGAATAACGPIAFLGLMVAHVARYLTGPDYRWLVPYAGLLGSVILLAGDIVGAWWCGPASWTRVSWSPCSAPRSSRFWCGGESSRAHERD